MGWIIATAYINNNLFYLNGMLYCALFQQQFCRIAYLVVSPIIALQIIVNLQA